MPPTIRARFAVGTPHGPHSSVWIVWANPAAGDLYLAARAIAGRWKWSFHASGDWREAFVTDQDAAEFGRKGRLVQRWQRPENMPGQPGWTLGFLIIVPAAELHFDPNAPPITRPVTWCPPPPPGHAAYISFLWASSEAKGRNLPPRSEDVNVSVRALGHFDLTNGDRVWIVNHDAPLTDEQRDLAVRGKRILQGATQHVERRPGSDLRAAYSGFREVDQSRFVLDMALDASVDAYDGPRALADKDTI